MVDPARGAEELCCAEFLNTTLNLAAVMKRILVWSDPAQPGPESISFLLKLQVKLNEHWLGQPKPESN